MAKIVNLDTFKKKNNKKNTHENEDIAFLYARDFSQKFFELLGKEIQKNDSKKK